MRRRGGGSRKLGTRRTAAAVVSPRHAKAHLEVTLVAELEAAAAEGSEAVDSVREEGPEGEAAECEEGSEAADSADSR